MLARNLLTTRSDTKQFQPHFIGQCAWPSLTSEWVERCWRTYAPAQNKKSFMELTILMSGLMTSTG